MKLDTYAVYVHWPFCLSKCPYCDFNSHVRENIDQDQFQAAYLKEIDHYAAQYPNLNVSSIFFGGGTPSLMQPKLVGAIIERVNKLWSVDGGVEITLEANPTSVEAERFKGFKAAGVNRLSLGIQSLRDNDLKALGRAHSASEALAALKIAQQTFDRYSFDLIYAREGQGLDSWREELSQALDYAGDHLSLYQLTIEPGTAFQGQFNKGKLILPKEGIAEEMFFLTREMTEVVGLPAYEVSNHAKDENRSRHNMAYWQGLGYLGIGPGAHGRIVPKTGKTLATNNWKKPEAWLRAVDANQHGQENAELLSAYDRGLERVMMGLRISEGVAMAELPDGVIDMDVLVRLQDQGFISIIEGRLVLNKKGQCLLDYILASLIA